MSLLPSKSVRKETRNGVHYLIFLCRDCFKEIRVRSNPFFLKRHQGHCKSCSVRRRNLQTSPCTHGKNRRELKDGSCAECRIEHSVEYRKAHTKSYRLYYAAKRRAKLMGVPWALTREYIESIWPEDNKCPIMGVEFAWTSKRGPSRLGATLDRIDPKLGYVVGNVAIISFVANCIKQDQTDPMVFRRLADWLENKQKIFPKN